MKKLISLKDLRSNMNKYASQLFKLSPVDDNENWEEVINFNQIKKGGVDIDKLLSSL